VPLPSRFSCSVLPPHRRNGAADGVGMGVGVGMRVGVGVEVGGGAEVVGGGAEVVGDAAGAVASSSGCPRWSLHRAPTIRLRRPITRVHPAIRATDARTGYAPLRP
jgi:hypothetical protein